MVVESALYLKRPVLEVVLEVLRPVVHHLRIFVIEDDVRDWVLRQLEHCRVDERVREEVVPAPPKHLLDGDRVVRVREIEEWRWVVDSLNRASLNTATSLREAKTTTWSCTNPESSTDEAHTGDSGAMP